MRGPTDDFWQMAGFGLMLFLIALGVGCCIHLS